MSGRGRESMQVELRYLVQDKDRHGNIRIYVRRPGCAKVRLRAAPHTDEFIRQYRDAVDGQRAAPRSASAAPPGDDTFRWLCQEYYKSEDYLGLAEETRRYRKRVLDKACQTKNKKGKLDGGLNYKTLTPEALRERIANKVGSPHAANQLLKCFRALYRYAYDSGKITRDPTRNVKRVRTKKTGGHHSWSLGEVEQFEARWPIGTRQRLALALLLYTSQRRSDMVKLGPPHVETVVTLDEAGNPVETKWITFTQQKKNPDAEPVTLSMPIIAPLQESIDAAPTGLRTFLVTGYGKPFSAAGFGNRFREWCDQADLPQCSAHGLRKAAAARLAELGASDRMIMAITGHATAAEVDRYTAAARQKVLAAEAMKLFEAGVHPVTRGRA